MPKQLDIYKPLQRLKVLVELIEHSYPDSRLVIALKGTPEETGDGLAEFIVNELGDAMHGDTWEDSLEAAGNMLDSAEREIAAVKAAVDALYAKEQEVRKPV